MIPYLEIPPLQLGPITIQAFGALVLTSVFAGYFFGRRRADAVGIPREQLQDAVVWGLGMGFLVSHLMVLFVYEPHLLSSGDIKLILNPSEGMSSFGGFIGGVLGAWIGARKVENRRLLFDVMLQGFVFGWIFSRLACSVAHDHPGVLTDFFLGMPYPDGVRHDLGFYEFLYTLGVLFPSILLINRLRLPEGTTLAVIPILYGIGRFSLDFLRIDQKLIAGLTVAQWLSMLLIACGVFVGLRLLRSK
jgi:phosphatidylglycerol:prolipoprotein diacylglycerol transferase